MAAPGSVVINFLARTADAVRDVDKLTRGVRDVGDESKKTDSKMGKLSGTLKAGLAAGAVAAGAGIVALGRFMVDAGKAALEDKASTEVLANTLKKIPGITDDAIAANEDWILSMQLATNVADTDLRKAIGKLALSTGNLEKAQDLATLAIDASTVSGKSLSTISDALAKAHDGNTSALKRMFPWLDKNKDGTLTYAEAVKGLGDKYEGAAKKAADANPWERLQTIWGELKESLVQFVIPLLGKLGDWFKKKENQKAVQDFIEDMGDLSYELGERVVPALEDFLKWLKDPKSKDAMKDFAEVAKTIASALGAAATGVKILFGYLKVMFALATPAWLQALIRLKGLGGDGSRAVGGIVPKTAAAPTAPILVTEDQIYLAVQGLLMRGERRHGGRPVRLLA